MDPLISGGFLWCFLVLWWSSGGHLRGSFLAQGVICPKTRKNFRPRGSEVSWRPCRVKWYPNCSIYQHIQELRIIFFHIQKSIGSNGSRGITSMGQKAMGQKALLTSHSGQHCSSPYWQCSNLCYSVVHLNFLLCYRLLLIFYFWWRRKFLFAPKLFWHLAQGRFSWFTMCFESNWLLINDFGFSSHEPFTHIHIPAFILCIFVGYFSGSPCCL